MTRLQHMSLLFKQVLQNRSEAAVSGSRQPHPCPPSPMPDIDSCDKEDPLAVADYVTDIFGYYKRMEPQLRVAPDYMTRQVGCRFQHVQDLCTVCSL